MYKSFIIVPVFLLVSIYGYAQSASSEHSGNVSAECVRVISLDDAISIAQDSTIAAYQNHNALLRSQWEYSQFLATRKPQLSFELNPTYQKFLSEPALHYYKFRDYNMLNTFGEFRLEQQALGLGGEFYATSGMIWTEYFGADAGSRIFSSVPLGIGYSNNLLSYNAHKWEKEIRDFHIESEKLAYNYELLAIAEKAENYYVECLVAEAGCNVCMLNSKVTLKSLEIGREKFEIASITKNELFSLELQHLNAENSLFDARQRVKDARSALFSYLQVEDNGEVLQIPAVPEYRYIDPEEALRMAEENNPDYRNKREEILRAQQRVDKARAESSFMQSALDLNLGIQNSSDVLPNAYSNQKFFAYGGITLKIPIVDGGLAKSRKKAAEYNLKYAETAVAEQLRVLELSVKLALNDFNTQQNLIDRTSKAVKLADESFALAQELYENGEIDINTFTLALNRKDDAYTNYLKSLQAYWNSWYALKKLCVVL